VLFIAVGFVFTGDNGSAGEQKPVVRMGVVPAAYYLPVFVVQERGLLRKRGYTSKVEIFAKNTDMMDAFLEGNLEFTAQSSGTMFPLESRHPNRFRFIYGQNNKSYSFIVPTNSEIKSLKDLKGKRVVTWPSPTA
jgi:ABC-type nitrate/sulfonate/bicarbonate transport system substrate-binding protein